MAELVICKSCGFVMEKGKLRDKCPACGVAAKMFEPYAEKISSFRKRVLSLDLHPILVHFPQAFAVSLLPLSLTGLVARGTLAHTVSSAVAVLGAALPFTVALSIIAGFIDAKIRFRRLTTPLLKKKILLGMMFFLFSCGIFAAILLLPAASRTQLITVAALSLPAITFASSLGIIGVSLLNAKFPG